MPHLSVIRAGFDRACTAFTEKAAPLGFAHTRSLYWTRPSAFTADVIQLSRSDPSDGRALNEYIDITIAAAVRVLNDPAGTVTANGPTSATTRGYFLRFGSASEPTFARVINELLRFTSDHALPFFELWKEPQRLVEDEHSPLRPWEREALRAALSGQGNHDHMTRSFSLLGL
jgi:hypothetical protein